MFRKADHVLQSHPEVEQPQAGDETATGSVSDQCCKPGPLGEEWVGVPEGRVPGNEADYEADVDADDDAKEALGLLQPVGDAI